ncbi:MAG: glyoxalase, partial [Alphaproteobacteria bacterium]|nr:glyoxalase [Alphaproteobacteria bacterium]
MGHPVVHFEIQAKDDAAAKKFYKKIFGWKIDSRNPMKYGMVSTKDADGAPGINGGLFRG